MSQVYLILMQSNNLNVKKTLAASLHEVARILGDDREVENELVPIFEDLIQVCVFTIYIYFPHLIYFNMFYRMLKKFKWESSII